MLLGAVRVQRGRGVVEPERVQAPEVERAAARRRSRARRRGETSSPPYSTGHVGTTRPDAANTGYQASYSARGRTSRTAAAPPRRPASIHAGGTFASTHARTSPTATSTGVLAIDVHRPSKRGARFSRNAAMPSRKSLGARRQLQRERLVRELRLRAPRSRPRASSHLVRPSATVGPVASCATTSSTAVVELGRREPRDGSRPTRPPRRRSSARPSSSSSRARTSPTRRGSSHVAPLSGVKPRSPNGSQKRASSAATVKSAASAIWKPMPGRPTPHLAHHRDLHACTAAGSAGAPAPGGGAGCCRRAACGRSAGRVAGDDVGAAAEVIARALEHDDAHARRRSRAPRPRRRGRASSRRRSRCACRAGRGAASSTPRRRRATTSRLIGG